MAILSRFLRQWPLVLVLLLGLAGGNDARAALSEEGSRRVALVVGNSEYRSVEPLKNAARDAREIARTLTSLGFEVIHRTDVSRVAFDEALEEFYARSVDADAAVIYYSGHGFQLGGVNYLVPVDATLRDRSAIAEETLRLDTIAARSQGANRQTLIFLDACRNDPLPDAFRGTATSEGLAQLETGSGTFIAFATQPGNITRDGAGDHSPFTSALLDHMPTPGISISDMMIRVRNQVEVATLKTQVPWDQSSLRSQFYFNPQAEADAGGELTEEDREMLLALDPAMRRKFEAKFGIRIDEEELAAADAPSEDPAVRPMVRIEASETAATSADPGTLAVAAQPRVDTLAALDPSRFDPAKEESATVPTTLRILPGGPSDADMVPESARTAVAAVPGVTVGPVSVVSPSIAAGRVDDGKSARPAYDPATRATIATTSRVPQPAGTVVASLESAARAATVASPALPESLTAERRSVRELAPSAAEAPIADIAADGASTRGLGSSPGVVAASAGEYRIAALSNAERSVSIASPGIVSLPPVQSDYQRVIGREVTGGDLVQPGKDGPEGKGEGEPAGAMIGPQLAAIDPNEIDGLGKAPPDKPDTAPADGAEEQAAPVPMPPADLPAAVQTELSRLGCYRSAIDGDWGSGSARALLRYYATKKADPDILEPNAALHTKLTKEGAVVCTRTEPEPAARRPTQRTRPAVAARPPAEEPRRAARPQVPRAPARTVATRRAAPAAPARQRAEAAPAAAPAPVAKRLGRSMTLGAFR